MQCGMLRAFAVLVSISLLGACGDRRGGGGPPPPPPPGDGGVGTDTGTPPGDDSAVPPSGLPLLGDGAHTPDAVALTTIATEAHYLNTPRDLAFHPERPDELWVANFADSAIIVLHGADTGSPEPDWRGGPGNTHFLAKPSALAFGATGSLATSHEEDQVTQPTTPPDFMGPTLWSSDLSIFDGGHAGHLDMLHNSPNGVGIAWERDNVYWVVDGYHGSLTRYDFRSDHGPGGADHSDGVVSRCVEGEISYVRGVPSHAELDRATGMLYVADTGNNRIAVLDTNSGTPGPQIGPNYDGTDQHMMTGTSTTTLVEGSSYGLVAPSGLALHDGYIFLTDNSTSQITAFDMAGNVVDYLDLSSEVSSGGLMGITVGPDGALYLVDAVGDRVLRVGPLGS